MSASNQISTPEAFDRHRRLVAVALLAMSVMFGAKAAEHLVGPGPGRYLDYLQLSMAVLMGVILARVVYWKLVKLPKGERHLYFSSDGFVMDSLNRAIRASWSVTFLLLMALEVFTSDDDFTTTLPSEFFLALAIAAMLGVVSSVFFFLNRADADESSHA